MTYHTTLTLVDGLSVEFDSDERPETEVLDDILYVITEGRTDAVQADRLLHLSVTGPEHTNE